MSEDLIRRSDAIKVAKEFWYKPDIAGALAELPAIEPKRGEWICGTDEDGNEEWTCSICGKKHPWYPNYCPHCGADMRKEGE